MMQVMYLSAVSCFLSMKWFFHNCDCVVGTCIDKTCNLLTATQVSENERVLLCLAHRFCTFCFRLGSRACKCLSNKREWDVLFFCSEYPLRIQNFQSDPTVIFGTTSLPLQYHSMKLARSYRYRILPRQGESLFISH
jgi:hypothetical protein